MNHALIVVERQQMLRHFYSMITPLLTLHTATTATLLVVSLTLNNTKKKQSLQSILQQSQQTNLPKLDLESRYRIVSQLGSYIVKLLIVDEYQNSGEQQSEEALKFQTTVFSTVNVLLTIKPLVFCTQRMSCPLSSLPKFGLSAPSLLGVARANWAPRCLLWICAFVLLIPIRSMFDVP